MQNVDMNEHPLQGSHYDVLLQDEPLAKVVEKLYRGWTIKDVIIYRYHQHLNNEGRGCFLIDDEGNIQGWYGIFPFAGEKYDYETTIYLASSLWGKGILQDIYEKLSTWLDDYPNTCISIHENLPQSLKAHQKVYDDWNLEREEFRKRNAWVHRLN